MKGFVFPDRASNDIYFATDNLVWGVTDTGAGGAGEQVRRGPISLGAGVKPSAVLFVPGSHYLYVGGTDGQLHELDMLGAPPEVRSRSATAWRSSALPRSTAASTSSTSAAEAGIFYAVAIPLPAGATCVPVASCTALNVGQACYISNPATECSLQACGGPGTCF